MYIMAEGNDPAMTEDMNRLEAEPSSALVAGPDSSQFCGMLVYRLLTSIDIHFFLSTFCVLPNLVKYPGHGKDDIYIIDSIKQCRYLTTGKAESYL